jgi:predicted nucleotidyltransferase
MGSISINNKLITFAQQELVLGYSSAERDRISGSLTQLQKVLKDKLYNEAKEIIPFGSYTRNTILPRQYDSNSDVDLLVVFNTSSGRKTPGTYRKNITDALSSSYPMSVVKKDFPTVKLELNHIMFDVVPSYVEELWSSKTYYIPSANDSWRTTVPNDINGELSQKNQSYGNNIVRNVIRLCKHWNSSEGRFFDSYEMEKWIVSRLFFFGDNLYDKFLSVMQDLAYHQHSGVKQALDWIKEYKGTWQREANEEKQFEWLQKLLPGLK